MTSLSRGSTLTPCRSTTPAEIPVQPDHFYNQHNVQLPPSPHSDGKTWLDPADDPLAQRGIPVFKPTMEEFQDFEGYMNRVEVWGNRSGIAKIIPPKEWTNSLPPVKDQLAEVTIKTPIEQHMLGHGGRFRQENMEKRKLMSVREWVELCIKDEFRSPGVNDVGSASRERGANVATKTRVQRSGKPKAEVSKTESSGPTSGFVVIKEEPTEESHSLSEGRTNHRVPTPPNSEGSPPAAPKPPIGKNKKGKAKKVVNEERKPRAKRVYKTREARDAGLADRAARDLAFLEVFDPHSEWLPSNTKAMDYTPEFCQQLERQYWRNLGLGKPAWYGADTQGSLFTDATTAWNVAHLPSALSRLLPSSSQGLPGVNTPYLYFGMWRATFAWHVEDMDLFSINYIHFGAPKFWYAIPQGRASGLEQTMRSYFPKDTSQCSQFLRHKSFLASPNVLAQDACRPNCLVQHAGEFVVTFPRGYHAGFNLGLNCAESVNFALESWLEVGRKAKACECVSDSVRIDVDQLIREREEERDAPPYAKEELPAAPTRPSRARKPVPRKDFVKQEAQDDVLVPFQKTPSRKRKPDANDDAPKSKKVKIKTSSSSKTSSSTSTPAPFKLQHPKISVTLRLGPRPAEPEAFPCCLCVSMSVEGLLRVQDPPISRKDVAEAAGNPKNWMAHEFCASIIPETWVDDLLKPDGGKERLVFGVDGIVKDRWNLKCSACTKNRSKAHGAPVQCTKGKCPKAFHVNCAKDGHSQGLVFNVVRDVEKDVVLSENDPSPLTIFASMPHQMQLDSNFTATDPNTMAVDSAGTVQQQPSRDSRVLKVVKKLEVQILCPQHNPAVAAQKKASKQDKIRNDLLAMPSMARIKIRVSAGVFEVSLVKVIEETSSVEVLWDGGIKREFKWGSVVFGNPDGPIQQKPSHSLEEPQHSLSAPHVVTFPSVSAATGQQTYAAHPASSSATPIDQSTAQASTNMGLTNHHPYANPAQFMYPPTAAAYSPYRQWGYATGATPYGLNGQPPYPYGYYPVPPTATVGSSQPVQQQQYPQYGYGQTYPQFRAGQLHWQQPYLPPPLTTQAQTQDESSASVDRTNSEAVQPPSSTQPQGLGHGQASTSTSNTQPTHQHQGQPQQQVPLPMLNPSSSGQVLVAQPIVPSSASNTTISNSNSEQQQRLAQDLSTLGQLQPAQITELLRVNPQLRDLVWAVVNQSQGNQVGV